jgi:hypothetical protein
MEYAPGMASGGMIHRPSSMKIYSCIRVTSLLLEQSERLQCLYYCWEGYMNYAFEMGFGYMIYVPSFIKIGSCVRKLTLTTLHWRRNRLHFGRPLLVTDYTS